MCGAQSQANKWRDVLSEKLDGNERKGKITSDRPKQRKEKKSVWKF